MNFSFPNESTEYRAARDALVQEEQALIEQIKAVARKRQALPTGGMLKENYQFSWATNTRLGEEIDFNQLFGNKHTLIIYSFMYGPDWDKPCPSCTSIVDGLDRMSYQVNQDAAFFVIGKAAPERINAWATKRGWNQISLQCTFQADYGCQRETDNDQYPMINVFQKVEDQVFHFWAAEALTNNIDMVWPYWNLMDLTPLERDPFRAT